MFETEAKKSSLLDHPLCEGMDSCPSTLSLLTMSFRTSIRVVRGLDVWKFYLARCLQNLLFISLKKLATFGYVVGVFLPRKFKLISENFKLVSQ